MSHDWTASMNTRADLLKAATRAIRWHVYDVSMHECQCQCQWPLPDSGVVVLDRDEHARHVAELVFDALLPQITTTEEIHDLPPGTSLIGEAPKLGGGRRPVLTQASPTWLRVEDTLYRPSEALRLFGPFVVWQLQPGIWPTPRGIGSP